MRSSLLFLFVVFLTSCLIKPTDVLKSREEKDKIRMGVLIKRNKDFLKTDTIRVRDTITTEVVETDTVFKQTEDTVYIEKDKLKIKYVYNTKTDSVFIEGKCDPDTVIIDKVVEVPAVNTDALELDCSIPWWIWCIIGALALLVIVVKFTK